jgi:hypothetical protein
LDRIHNISYEYCMMSFKDCFPSSFGMNFSINRDTHEAENTSKNYVHE